MPVAGDGSLCCFLLALHRFCGFLMDRWDGEVSRSRGTGKAQPKAAVPLRLQVLQWLLRLRWRLHWMTAPLLRVGRGAARRHSACLG